jgi:predicted TIM-barrel fold metal-dependent hydrolase
MPEYRVISSDSHLEVKPETWAHRIPEKWREHGPRVIRQADGGDAFMIEDIGPIENPQDTYAGKTPETWKPFQINYDEVAGTGPPEQRIREQDIDGVDAEILFASQVGGPGLWRRVKDDPIYLSIVQAYNSWLAEEYSITNPDRLIGLGVIPNSNLEDAMSEMQRCLELGLRGIVLSTFPSGNPYPTPEDDKFWQAAVDQKLPVTIHVAFRGGPPGSTIFRYPIEPPELMPKLVAGSRRSILDRVARYGIDCALTVSQLVLSGLFDRIPDLEIFEAETHVGWLPFWYESADLQYNRNIHWAEQYLGYQRLKRLPSEYIKDHFHWSLQGETFGIQKLRYELGVDKLMWATDFPHIECEYPHSREAIEHEFAGVPKNERHMMLAGNAVNFFHLAHTTGAK